MPEICRHSAENRDQLFKYVLRLLAVDEACELEAHYADCDDCAAALRDITRFCDLLQHGMKGSRLRITAHNPIDRLSTTPTTQNIDEWLHIFTGCYNGFQKLRKNIGAKMAAGTDPEVIERAAIQILLALPNEVSKI